MKFLTTTVLVGSLAALAVGQPIAANGTAKLDIKPIITAYTNKGATGFGVTAFTWSLNLCESVIPSGLYGGFESAHVYDGFNCDVFTGNDCTGTKRHLNAATYPNIGFDAWAYRCNAA